VQQYLLITIKNTQEQEKNEVDEAEHNITNENVQRKIETDCAILAIL